MKKALLLSLFFIPSITFAERFGSIRSGAEVPLSTQTIRNSTGSIQAPSATFFVSSGSVLGQFIIRDPRAGGGGSPSMIIESYADNEAEPQLAIRNRNPAIGKSMAVVYQSTDSAGNMTDYGDFLFYIVDTTNGSEDSSAEWHAMRAGTRVPILIYSPTGDTLTTNSGTKLIFDSAAIYRDVSGGIIIDPRNTGSGNPDVIIGAGASNIDYRVFFNGQTNDGSFTYMEDEDEIRASDPWLFQSSSTVSGKFQSNDTASLLKGASVSTLTITGLTSQNCIGTDGSGNVQAGTCGGGGGASTLGVTTGSASGFASVTSTPTSTIVFSSDVVNGQLTGASTFFFTLKASSVTLQGNTTNQASALSWVNASGFIPNSTIDPSSVTKLSNSTNTTSSLAWVLATGKIPNSIINGASVTMAGPTIDMGNSLEAVGVVPAAQLGTGSTNYIQHASALQSGSTFYVSSGTVGGDFFVRNGTGTFQYGVIAGSVTTSGNGNAAGELRLFEAPGTDSIGIRAANSMSSDYNTIWPSTIATGGQVLMAQSISGTTITATWGTMAGGSGTSDNLGNHTATTTLNMASWSIDKIGASSSAFFADGTLFVRSTGSTVITTSGTGVGGIAFGDSDGSNFVTLIASPTITTDFFMRMPASTAAAGGSFLKHVNTDGSTVTFALARTTFTHIVSISSRSVWTSLTLPVFTAPDETAITITKIKAETMPTNSTVTYQLDERAFGSINSAGTDIFTVSESTANNTGTSTGTFNNASIAAGASIIFKTDASATVGSPTDLKFTIYYTKDD